MKLTLPGAPRIERIGIAYMYAGAWLKAVKDASADHEFHVGPHLMGRRSASGRVPGIQSRRVERDALRDASAESH